MNPRAAVELHQTKPAQLAMVSGLGVAIPRTYLGNDVDAALAFAERVGDVVVKPVQGGYLTRPLDADLRAQITAGALDLAPATLQENVRGRDVRAFCFDDDVVAIAIDGDTTDFRGDARARFSVHEVPPRLARVVRRVRRALGLRFSGMDFKLTADGRYVFLEANPSPMFIGFEARTGLPLTDGLVRLLTAPRGRRHRR